MMGGGTMTYSAKSIASSLVRLSNEHRLWISNLKLQKILYFSWLEYFRWLTIDYVFLAETAEAMVQIAFIQIMLNRFIE